MIKKDIENISLGPRQLLFDFEIDKSKEQAKVISCIENKIEKCGHVDLDECVHQAGNIKNMNLCLIEAEEKFDVFWDEIEI